jgi:penicillin-binding protein 3
MRHRLFFLTSLFIILILAGCSADEVRPDEVFDTYVKLWSEQNFSDMYEMHTDNAMEYYTKGDFIARYEKIYSDIEISDIKVEYEKLAEDEKITDETKSVIIPFTVSLYHCWTS